MWIGEAPGAEENRSGKPFVGPAGMLFNSLLTKTGVDRGSIFVTNVLHCAPFDGGKIGHPTTEQIASCRYHLLREIEIVNPEVIIVMGQTAYTALMENDRKIGGVRGKFDTVELGFGCGEDGNIRKSFVVMPTWHPSYALRGGGEVTEAFSQMVADVNVVMARINPPKSSFSWKSVRTMDDFERFKIESESWSHFAFDIETEGLELFRSRIVGVSFAPTRDFAWYMPLMVWNPDLMLGDGAEFPIGLVDCWGDNRDRVLHHLTMLLSGPARKVAHNGKFDVTRLKTMLNIDVSNWVFDTQLAQHVLNENLKGYSLDEMLASRYPDLATYGEGIKEIRGTPEFLALPFDDFAKYACCDAIGTARLAADFNSELAASEHEAEFFRRFTMPTAHLLAEMELNGMVVDLDYCTAFRDELEIECSSLLVDIREKSGIATLNPNSPVQMSKYFFETMKYASIKKTKKAGKPAVDVDVLEKLADDGDPVAGVVQEWRQRRKIIDSFLKTLPEFVLEDGRIHANFHQHRTVSGRLSCTQPNMQAIPARTELGARVRGVIVAPEGHSIICVDYSQMELRVLAWVVKEPTLLQACYDGTDMHLATARKMYEKDDISDKERYDAKRANFAILNNVAPDKLARVGGISVTAARKLIADWYRAFPKVREWTDMEHRNIAKLGYGVSAFGRVRRLPMLKGKSLGVRDGELDHMRRQYISFLIQEPASDVTSLNTYRLAQHLHRGSMASLGCQIVNIVHDANYTYCPDEHLDVVVPFVKQTMETSVVPFDIPFSVEVKVVKRWSEAK
jgi:DNA polymerase-1